LASKSTEMLFLDKDTSSASLQGKGVLILSPAFYWFVKEKMQLPLSQAKKIAPSIFEGIVPPGEYSYYVQKVGEEHWFFAYKDQEILNKLASLGIKPSQIAKVYPAQLLFYDIQEPIKIENLGKVLVNDNGTVILLPQSLVTTGTKNLKELQLSLPRHSLPLRAYSSFAISEDMIYRFSILVFIAIVAYAVEVFIHKKDLAKLVATQEALMQKYHLPATSIQIKSILSSLQKIQKEQLKLREELEYILRLPLSPTEFIKSLEFGKEIRFEVELSDPKRAEFFKNYLVKKLHVVSMSVKGKTLFVKCRA